MRPLQIADAETMILGLQDEIRRSEESRYDHRLHGVLLVAQGATCPEVSRLLGDAPRTVENWVRRFEAQGLAGLTEGPRSGRPRRLSEAQLREVDGGLRQTPRDLGLAGTLVGWEDVERLDRATLPSPLAGASMPAFVPAAGLSAA
jgi:transposase-like protein